jgi:hypothetical protein
MKVVLSDLIKNPKVKLFIEKADEQLAALGYTEHGSRHVTWVAKRAGKILRELGYPKRTAELAEIAAYLHDIGNLVNREYHAQTGAILAERILSEMGMDYREISEIMMAIGNHHEEDGYPGTPIVAALILADKADVHRSRVRPVGNIREDIHDRVNYAATSSQVLVDQNNKVITYKIEIDTNIAPVMEYFQIFLSRMLIASKAAKSLGCRFELYINETKMI